MEAKSINGTASLTETHLRFEFPKRLRKFKRTAVFEIPLADITDVQYTPSTVLKRPVLRVRATGHRSDPAEMSDPCTMMLGSEAEARAFADRLVALTGAQVGEISAQAAEARADAASVRRAEKAEAKVERTESVASNPQAQFAGYSLAGGIIRHGIMAWDVRGSSVSVDVGSPKKGLTATRVVMLGVFSLAAKKDKSKLFITIDTPTQTLIIEGSAKDERNARLFAAAVARSA